MPGFELIGKKENQQLNDIFKKSNGVLFGHAFEKLRNNISKNSIDTIEKFYKQEYFNKTLEETIGLVIKNI